VAESCLEGYARCADLSKVPSLRRGDDYKYLPVGAACLVPTWAKRLLFGVWQPGSEHHHVAFEQDGLEYGPGPGGGGHHRS
jgi:hypothetical protein